MRIERWLIPLAFFGLLAFATTAPAADEKEEKSSVKLPKAVKKAVKALYPDAKIRGTAKEKDEEGETVYEVELLVKGKTVDLLIDPEGEIEETEKEIAVSDLPKAVIKAIAKAHPKAKVQKVEEVTGEDDKVTYEVALKKGKKSIEVVFVPNGKILKSGDAEEEDDDKAEAKKGKKEGDEEDEDDDKAKSKKEMDDDDEDEDDKPKVKSKKEKGEDDEGDDKPNAKKKEMDDDEDDDKDSKKSKSKNKKEKDDDGDDDDDEDDDEEDED